MTRLHVLTFDGGPAAFLAARLLQQVEAQRPGTFAATTHFAGTSSGAALALYYALKLSDPQADVDQVLQGGVDFINAIGGFFAPDETAFRNLLCGQEAMYSAEPLRVISQTYLGDARLSDLALPVVILSTRMNTPWQPEILSWVPGSPVGGDRLLVDIALQSGACPIVLPLQGLHTDGGLFQNNPAMAALSALLSRRRDRGSDIEGLGLDDIALWSLGADDGSSSMSNRRLPGQTGDMAVAEPESVLGPDIVGPTPAVQAVLPADLMAQAPASLVAALALSEQVALAPAALEKALRDLLDRPEVAAHIDLDFFKSRLETVSKDGEPQSWGWSQWLTYLFNPLYLGQVFLNSQGRGTSEMAAGLLLDGTLRLGPVGALGTNQQFLMLMLGLWPLLLANATMVSELWAWAPTSKLLGFQPTVTQTLAWLDLHWNGPGGT